MIVLVGMYEGALMTILIEGDLILISRKGFNDNID